MRSKVLCATGQVIMFHILSLLQKAVDIVSLVLVLWLLLLGMQSLGNPLACFSTAGTTLKFWRRHSLLLEKKHTYQEEQDQTAAVPPFRYNECCATSIGCFWAGHLSCYSCRALL